MAKKTRKIFNIIIDILINKLNNCDITDNKIEKYIPLFEELSIYENKEKICSNIQKIAIIPIKRTKEIFF